MCEEDGEGRGGEGIGGGPYTRNWMRVWVGVGVRKNIQRISLQPD